MKCRIVSWTMLDLIAANGVNHMRRTALFVAKITALSIAALAHCNSNAFAGTYNWRGWYFGGNIGYGWGTGTNPSVDFIDGNNLAIGAFFAAGGNILPSVKSKGVVGGGQLGYNWTFQQNLVLGWVADFQTSGISGSGTAFVSIPGFSRTTQSNSIKIDWFGTARAKAGWAQYNWLVYATGGLAYGSVKTSGTADLPDIPLFLSASSSGVKAGWTVGGGIDYALAANWTLGVEYLYLDLGRQTYTFNGAPSFPLTTLNVSNHAAASIARMTVNYKF